jgi:hypothetical protein
MVPSPLPASVSGAEVSFCNDDIRPMITPDISEPREVALYSSQ